MKKFAEFDLSKQPTRGTPRTTWRETHGSPEPKNRGWFCSEDSSWGVSASSRWPRCKL